MLRLDHRWASGRLGPYIDDELDMGSHERLVLHLSECPDCANTIVVLASIKSSLRRHHRAGGHTLGGIANH